MLVSLHVQSKQDAFANLGRDQPDTAVQKHQNNKTAEKSRDWG